MRVCPTSSLSKDTCALLVRNAPCTGPCHSERSEVWDLQRLGDVITTHRARALDKNVCALTRFPGCLEEVIYPSTELFPT